MNQLFMVSLGTYLTEFWKYSKTVEYRQNIYSNLSVMFIDLFLLSLLVPLVVWLWAVRKIRKEKNMANFYALQLQRATVLLLLELGKVNSDPRTYLTKMVDMNVEPMRSSNVYGNTEKLLWLLRTSLEDGSYSLEYDKASLPVLESLHRKAETLLDQVDRYILLFSSFGLNRYKETFFQIRTAIIYPLGDLIEDVAESKGLFSPPRELAVISLYQKALSDWFKKEKARPDKAYNRKRRICLGKLYAVLPALFAYRLIWPWVCRIVGICYSDIGTNYARYFFALLLERYEGTLENLSAHLGVKVKRLKDYARGYERPDHDQIAILETRIKELIPEADWKALRDDASNMNRSSREHSFFWRITVDAANHRRKIKI